MSAVGLVGRQRELSDARAALDAALAGGGGLLLIAGEAGIGKTRLAEALLGRASGRTVWTACWDDPGTPAFWPWVTALRDCAEAAGLPPGDELGPLLGTATSASGPAAQLRLRLFDGVSSYLVRSARPVPLTILLEDLHFADQASLDLLAYLAKTLRGKPVALVGTHRYPDLDPAAPLATALTELSRWARSIPLYGLGDDHVAALITQTTGSAPDPRLVTRIQRRTSGNPLFVTEFAKLLAAHGGDPGGEADQLPMPSTVEQTIAQRLGYLSSAAANVLAYAAVAGQVFTERLLARLTGEPPGRLAQLLDEASRAALVMPHGDIGQFTLTHALVRDVLYAGIPVAQRRTRHRQVAEAIEQLHGSDVDEQLDRLADHYFLALPEADPARAFDYARRAGQRAMGRLAHEQAARQFTRAAELAAQADVDEAERVALLLALGEARLRAGDWPAAGAAYHQAAASARRRGRADELARAALGFGAGLSGFEVRLFDQSQLELLREALDGLGDDQPRLRAWVLARLSVAESFLVAEDERVAHSGEAVHLARRIGDPKLLAYALSSYCDAIPGPEHTAQRLVLAEEMISLGEAAQDPESELLGRRFRVVALLESGDIIGVDTEIEAFAQTAARLRWPLVEWYPVMWRGMRALIEGRLDDAERLAARAKEIGRRGGSVNADLTGDYSLLPYVLLERGRLDEVYQLVEEFLDEPEAGPDTEAWAVLPLARMGRRAEARAVIDRLAAAGFPLATDSSWLDKAAALAEACAELDHVVGARALRPVLAPFADRFSAGGTGTCCVGSIDRHLGLLAGCLGDWHQAGTHFDRALAAHRAAGATLLVAHTLRQHAQMLLARAAADGDARARGDTSQASAMRAEADEIYRQLGLDHWIPGGSPIPAGDGAPAEPTQPQPQPQPNHFRRQGDVWDLRFRGHRTHLRDAKGLAVIARLLAEPGREFHVFDLVEHGGGLPGAGASTSTGEVIDAQARQAYRKRLHDLESDLDEATLAGDEVRATRAQAERDALVEQLTAAYGLGGRARFGNDPVERARTTVTKRIRDTIARIERLHPALGQHLRHSVKTGRYCAYTPELPTDWLL